MHALACKLSWTENGRAPHIEYSGDSFLLVFYCKGQNYWLIMNI